MTMAARNIFKVASAAMNLLSSTLTLLFFLRDMLAALSSLMPLLDYLIASSPHASLPCLFYDCHLSFSPALVTSSLHAFIVSLTTANPHSAKTHHLCKNKAICIYSLFISNILQVYTKVYIYEIELNITISLPHHLTIPLVQLTMPITIHTPILLARIVIHTRPAVIRTLLIPFAATVIACAKPRAVTRVNIAALVGHVADFVGATLAAARAAAGLVLDGRGGAAAGLVVVLVLKRGWETGETNGVDGLAAVNAGVGLGDVACVKEAGYALAVLWDD
jgi:hypothetical protein